MKTVTLTLVMLLSVSAYAQDWSVWFCGDAQTVEGEADAALGVRVGYEVKPQIEIGFGAHWWPKGDLPDLYYGWAFYESNEPVDIPEALGPIEQLIETLPELYPYTGPAVGVNLGEGVFLAWISGVRFWDICVVEHRLQVLDKGPEQDEHLLTLGVRIEF